MNPAEVKPFNVRIRVPDRNVSQLYTASPASDGLTDLAINGTPVTPIIEHGYAVLSRPWKSGDKIEFVLPLQVQRVKASDRIAATRGRVALRYGPLIYNLESVDQDVECVLRPDAELSTHWNGDLLGGVLVIKGVSAGGDPLIAIPNYARLNRGGRSLVWVKDR